MRPLYAKISYRCPGRDVQTGQLDLVSNNGSGRVISNVPANQSEGQVVEQHDYVSGAVRPRQLNRLTAAEVGELQIDGRGLGPLQGPRHRVDDLSRGGFWDKFKSSGRRI